MGGTEGAAVLAVADTGKELAGLVAGEGGRLLRLAERLMGNRADAEEVVQEGLLRAQGALANFRGEGSLLAWVRSIVVNEALHRLRRRRLAQRVSEFIGRSPREHPLGWQAASPRPDAELDRNERLARLQRALERLPARQRVAISLRYLEQLDIGDIARLTGVGPGTVKTHLVRGLKKLRRLLEPLHGGYP